MPRAVLFVGPSLARDELQNVLSCETEIRPPVRRGDLEEFGADTVVAIVDGVFMSTLAVSVREVLHLLQRGALVYGSSSMGALRAAELSTHGMKGVGWVYEMFQRGVIDSDAEVALLFDPTTLLALTEPLINIRYALQCAQAEGELEQLETERLLAIARDIHFSNLTYATLLRRASAFITTDALSRFERYVRENRASIDIKRLDALRLIGILNSGQPEHRVGLA